MVLGLTPTRGVRHVSDTARHLLRDTHERLKVIDHAAPGRAQKFLSAKRTRQNRSKSR